MSYTTSNVSSAVLAERPANHQIVIVNWNKPFQLQDLTIGQRDYYYYYF